MNSVAVICLCILSFCWAGPITEEKISPIKKHSGVGIIGGSEAVDGQFPWQVAVYFDTPDGTFFCGGALIASNWVITSGHCVYHAVVFTLHLGSNTLVDADDYRVTLGVSHSVVHPDFDPDSLQHNIGLIRIDVNYTANERIQVIPLDTDPLEGGVPVTVSGWGATGDWDGVVDQLNFVDLTTMTNTDCQAVFGDAVTEDMVCAKGTTTEGTCDGDNGGPLVRTVGSDHLLVGVISWVSSSGCKTDHPSGYTRTAYYIDWIRSVIG